VSFTDHGKTITKPAFLHVVEVAATQRDAGGEQEPQPLLDDGGEEDEKAGDGYFSILFGGDSLNRGRGELVINAKGRTFAREKRLTFEVVPPVDLQLNPDESGKRLLLEAKADAELIDPGSLQAGIWLEDMSGGREAVALDGTAGSLRGEIDLMAFTGPRRVVIEADAVLQAGDKIRFVDTPAEVEGIGAPPPEPPPEPTAAPPPTVEPSAKPEPPVPPPEAVEESAGWAATAVWFTVINLLLLSVGGGLFWWLRRRRQHMVQLIEEDETVTEAEEKPA